MADANQKLEETFTLLKAEVAGEHFKTLGPLIERINSAKVEVGQKGRQVQIWAQGSPDIKNSPKKGFGVLWADLVVGKKDIKDGVVPPRVISEVSILRRKLLIPETPRSRARQGPRSHPRLSRERGRGRRRGHGATGQTEAARP